MNERALTLFITPTSPYVRQCRIVVRERGLESIVQEQSIGPDPLADEAYLAANPAGHGPALVCADGLTLTGPQLVSAYLDTLGDAAPLRDKYWQGREIRVRAHAATEFAVRWNQAWALPENERPRKQLQDWRDGLERTLDWLEANAPSLEPLQLSAISTGVTVGYLSHRHPTLDWRAGRSKLAALSEQLEARESFRATAAP